jgi:hypothetical protein
MAGAGLFWEKSTAGWLLVADLLWEKSTAGWWLISQANRADKWDNLGIITEEHMKMQKFTYYWVKNLVIVSDYNLS